MKEAVIIITYFLSKGLGTGSEGDHRVHKHAHELEWRPPGGTLPPRRETLATPRP